MIGSFRHPEAMSQVWPKDPNRDSSALHCSLPQNDDTFLHSVAHVLTCAQLIDGQVKTCPT